jgi:hypothetical protein
MGETRRLTILWASTAWIIVPFSRSLFHILAWILVIPKMYFVVFHGPSRQVCEGSNANWDTTPFFHIISHQLFISHLTIIRHYSLQCTELLTRVKSSYTAFTRYLEAMQQISACVKPTWMTHTSSLTNECIPSDVERCALFADCILFNLSLVP